MGDRQPVSLTRVRVSSFDKYIVQPLRSDSQAVILIGSSKSRHGDIRGRTLTLESASVSLLTLLHNVSLSASPRLGDIGQSNILRVQPDLVWTGDKARYLT